MKYFYSYFKLFRFPFGIFHYQYDAKEFSQESSSSSFSLSSSSSSLSLSSSNSFSSSSSSNSLSSSSSSEAIAWYDSVSGCIIAYQAKGAASYSESLVNLKQPGTYDLTKVGASDPNWDVDAGWSVRTTAALNTNWIPATNVYSALIRVANVTTAAVVAGASTSGSKRLYLKAHTSTDVAEYAVSGGVYTSGTPSSGVIGVTPTNPWLDGVKFGGITLGGWSGSCTTKLYIGCANIEGLGPGGGMTNGTVQAFAVYSGTLSDSDMATISAAMANI